MKKSRMELALRRLRQHCRERGLRLTPMRLLVYRCLLQGEKVSAYQLLDLVQQYKPAVRAMSVYRALDFLQQQDFVHRVDASRTFVPCCLDGGHSEDISLLLECSACSQVEEVSLGARTSQLLCGQLRAVGYHSSGETLQMQTVCDSCSSGTVRSAAVPD